MKMTRLAYAVATIGLATSAWAADEAPAKTERIEVTGSSIKRVAKEGPAPIEVLTRKQIEKTGATTVNELIKTMSTIDIFDQGELASNAPSGSGTANVRMRGMAENQVLVLLNGKRLPRNALADSSGAGDAVDINMIPISAIERVEVLKDGGSAIYGADAVAGVMNFITKKNYVGGDIGGRLGTSSRHDGTEKGATISGGFGDYDEQGFNVFAALDIFKRDPIYRKDRELSKSVDFRRLGGPDRRSSASPFGNILDNEGNPTTGLTVKPCPPELKNRTCRYDFNAELLTAYNGADRTSFMSVGSLKINEAIKASAQVVLAQSKDHFEAHPVPDTFILPDGRQYLGRFVQGGPRITDRKSLTTQLTAGLEGATAGIDWSVSATKGRSKVTNSDSNYFNKKDFRAAARSGKLDATISNNDAALVDSLRLSPKREGTYDLTSLDAKLSGELFKLGGGPLGYAVGASRWTEKLSDRPDQNLVNDNVLGGIKQASADAKRSAYAVFGELAMPVTDMVEVQTALRYDHYPTGSKTSPKVAVSIRPTKDLLLRSSYTSSFKMPGLKQLYGSEEKGATNFTEDQCQFFGQPDTCDLQGDNIGGANPALKPEKGKTFNIGAVLDLGVFSGSVDWWAIQQSDSINSPSTMEALKNGQFGRDPVTGRPFVSKTLRNIGQTESRGLDTDMSLRFKTGLGTLTFRDAATYYRYIKQRTGAGDFEYLTGVYGTTPTARWRNTFSVGLDAGTWSLSTAFRTISGLKDVSDLPTAAHGVAADARQIPSHTEVDLVGSYTGIKGVKLDMGVKNLADRMPPFSLTNADSNSNTQMGFAELYSSRGRFFYAAGSYRFK
ncbi:iron complex outermembrane receptor protein [Chitinivorax tropicus]|uniref:Iron complex outermembrane receptor protein n=1 Tax=Chitinivorax tropicus TaxID=714531 RepID=A0A840MRR7_9PROT|nr:TonB-dependent receptor [Chitinivorax tropicus]MBB5020115.1 iron complex outermembrane receptor protein [Chitinivorax tropicus]